MTNVTALSRDYSDAQIRVIRQTIAADLTDPEFNMFCEQARRAGLDPFRRQIFPIVFSAKNPAKRRVSIITGIDGYRALAQRCADYRPDHEEPRYTYSADLKSPTNPHGIEKCVVAAHKYSHGEWSPIPGAAYWDEFAVTSEEWAEDSSGKRKPTGKKTLADNWARMPRLMIAKVAEAQSLRRGWPEVFSGIHTEEEMDRSRAMDATASDLVAAAEATERAKKLGGPNAIIVDWLDGSQLERLPDGSVYDRVFQWANSEDQSASDIAIFQDRNAAAFRDFWQRQAHDALELRKALDGLKKRKQEAEAEHAS